MKPFVSLFVIACMVFLASCGARVEKKELDRQMGSLTGIWVGRDLQDIALVVRPDFVAAVDISGEQGRCIYAMCAPVNVPPSEVWWVSEGQVLGKPRITKLDITGKKYQGLGSVDHNGGAWLYTLVGDGQWIEDQVLVTIGGIPYDSLPKSVKEIDTIKPSPHGTAFIPRQFMVRSPDDENKVKNACRAWVDSQRVAYAAIERGRELTSLLPNLENW